MQQVRLRSLAWLPLPLLTVLASIYLVRDSRVIFLPRTLLLPLNIALFSVSLCLMAFIIGWCYLIRGTWDLLFMGSAALCWGLAGAIGGAVEAHDVNNGVTITSLGAWLCAALNLAAAFMSVRSKRAMARKPESLAGAYTLTVIGVAVLSALVIAHDLPVFFVESQGGTAVRQFVLGCAIFMFLFGGLLLRVAHRRSLSSFLHWYTLALFLMALSLTADMLELSDSGALSWTDRFMRYLGGTYMIVAATSTAPSLRHWTISLDEALTAADRRYSDLFNLAADGIIVHEPISAPSRGRIWQANSAACTLLGYSEQDLRDLTLLDLLAPEHAPEERRRPGMAESVLRHEKVLVGKDGNRIPTEMTTREFDDPSGPMEISVIRDITDRRLAEFALQESEQRLRLALSAGQIGTFEYHPDTGELIMDARAKALWGLPPDAVLGISEAHMRVHPGDRQRFEENIELALDPRGGGTYESEHRVVWPDGSVHWHTAKGRVEFKTDGGHRRASRLIGVHLDNTGQKQSELALWEAIQRLDAHIDNSPLAAIEFDPEFRVTRWSDEACRMFGWTAGEVLGQSLSDMHLSYEADAEKVRENSQAMREGRLRRNMTVTRNYRRDGSVIECEWYNSAIFDAEGRLSSVLSQVLDVTDRKRSEERLRQAQKMESIAILAGGVAHDFNNLLVGVIGNASLAMEILPAGNPATGLLEGIIAAGEQAAHLTRQMLAYSGQGRFRMEPVDLSELVHGLSDLIRATTPMQIAIQMELAPDLPPVHGDRAQIRQALMNLVTNANEAIGDNPGLIAIETGIRDVTAEELKEYQGAELIPGRYVTLMVRDTGSGIDEPTKTRIFDPFFTTKFQGRGLGLPAVAGIVRGHKGALRVRTAPGRGTSFLLAFPILSAPPASESSGREQLAEPDFSGRGTVLIVDDEARVQMAARLALEHRGGSVITASSGDEAIQILRADPERIALVILDLSMPGMSGAEALPRMLEIKPDLAVLVSSGYAEEDALSRFEGLPVAGFLQKPYTAHEIAEKVDAVLQCPRPDRSEP